MTSGRIIAPYDVPLSVMRSDNGVSTPISGRSDRYTGVLKATNFEIFRETLEENHMGHQSEDFLHGIGETAGPLL